MSPHRVNVGRKDSKLGGENEEFLPALHHSECFTAFLCGDLHLIHGTGLKVAPLAKQGSKGVVKAVFRHVFKS
jgi:hypothetical protein